MSHLPLSLMNRLNKTETAVFKFQVVCFQRISFQIICRLKIFHFRPPMRFGRLKMSKIILYTEIINISYLYSRHLCRGLYSFRISVRPFVRSYVRSFVCSFVRSFVLPSRLWNYFKVLRSSNSSGVYLTNHSSESIHIWTIGTLEGRLSFHDSSLQGLCPGMGLEVKF